MNPQYPLTTYYHDTGCIWMYVGNPSNCLIISPTGTVMQYQSVK